MLWSVEICPECGEILDYTDDCVAYCRKCGWREKKAE